MQGIITPAEVVIQMATSAASKVNQSDQFEMDRALEVSSVGHGN
jgi:hypothetical protein